MLDKAAGWIQTSSIEYRASSIWPAQRALIQFDKAIFDEWNLRDAGKIKYPIYHIYYILFFPNP